MRSLVEVSTFGAQMTRDGRLSSIVLAEGGEAFLLNSEHTVILRYEITPLKEPIRFRCADCEEWEGIRMTADDKVEFTIGSEHYTRTKTVKPPPETFTDVKAAFGRIEAQLTATPSTGFLTVTLKDKILSMLDENLSHIEFFVHPERMVLGLRQRDIYGGSSIEIVPKANEADLFEMDALDKDTAAKFVTTALRTKDFVAMMLASPQVSFMFPIGQKWTAVAGSNFSGFLGNCVYDSLIMVDSE